MNKKNLIDQTLTLKLNRNWKPVGVDTVRDAFKNFAKGTHNALHILWPVDEYGNEVYDGNPDYMEPVSWDDWGLLDSRQCDKFIGTGHKTDDGFGQHRVRIPTVLISKECTKDLIITPALTSENIILRDEQTCQYTGERLQRKQLNIDHIIPQCKGGKTTWENCVACNNKINTMKGDMDLKDFTKKYGYKLIRRPEKPRPRAMINIIKNRFKIPDWDIFLNVNKKL